MCRTSIAAAVGAVLAAAGLSVGIGLSQSASASVAVPHADASISSEQPVVINCQNMAQIRPGTFTLACADGNDALVKMSWTSWTPRLATGYGTETLNDCIPNCAEGHFRNYPVLAVLWGNAAVTGHPGEQRYTMYTLIYPGARPPHYTVVNGKVVTTYPVSRTDPLWA